MKWINLFNVWFDGVQEPRRFMLALSLVFSPLIILDIGQHLQYQYEVVSTICLTIGSLWLLLIAIIALHRMYAPVNED